MSDKKMNVLFVSTDNAARGLFAEAILNRWGTLHFKAFSAGLNPSNEIDPLTADVLQRNKYQVQDLTSSSIAEFQSSDAEPMDFVFLLSPEITLETDLQLPGDPMIVRWHMPPLVMADHHLERLSSFYEAFRALDNRIKIFSSLPIQSLDKLKLQTRLEEIGQMQVEAEAVAD